jgi:hypothetical protein
MPVINVTDSGIKVVLCCWLSVVPIPSCPLLLGPLTHKFPPLDHPIQLPNVAI